MIAILGGLGAAAAWARSTLCSLPTVVVAGLWAASAPDRARAPDAAAHPTASAHPTAAIALAVAASLAFGVSLYATVPAGADLPVSWVVLSARAIGVVALALPLALTRRLELTRSAVPLVVASGLCEVIGF